jgi:hypothetical protein
MDNEVAEETLKHSITWTQAAETEIQDCYTFKLPNIRSAEISRIEVKFPPGSHHVHLYRALEPVVDEHFDCFKGIDWKKWSLVIGAQTEPMDWRLPEGVTFPFEPHQQLLAQVHWLNTTDKPETSTIDLAFHSTTESEEHLGVLFGVNQRVELGPKQQMRTEHYCQLPNGAKLIAMMGHFHAHGNDYRIIERMPNQSAGTEIYYAKDEPSFEFKTFSPARPVAPGAGLQYECGFNNWENFTLTWGSDTATQEHCNMTVYFSPADKTSDMCLLETSKVATLSITPAADSVRAGQDVTFAIELVTAEATDIEVSLASSDPQALAVPRSVKVRAGSKTATFTAQARRPAQVDVSLTHAGARLVRPVRITGLAISEVFYSKDGDLNDYQWVELANNSNVSLDLSNYVLGAGKMNLRETKFPLSGTIPAGGCIVVGGKKSDASNGSPLYALAQDFHPDLFAGMQEAAGIGLFNVVRDENGNIVKDSEDKPVPATRGIDVLVYGAPGVVNTVLYDRDGQTLAPVWPGAAAGQSLRRVSDTIWQKSSEVRPGICEVLNAM